MTEAKAKRIAIAVTIGAVILAFVLFCVLVFQFVEIGKGKAKYNELNTEIARYKELKENGENTLEARSSYWWIVSRARELGYVFDGDKILK